MALFGGDVRTIPYQAPDYSGSVAAAREQSMAGAQGVAKGIGQVTDYFKQQGEKKKLIKQSDIQIDAALKLFPELAPTLQGVRDQIKDENVSLNERADIAESVAGLINMGTKQMQADAEFGLQERKVKLEEQRAKAEQIQASLPKMSDWKPYDKEIEIDGQKVKVAGSLDQYGQFKDLSNNVYPSVSDAFSPTGPPEPSFPDGVPVDGTPMDGPGVLPPKGAIGVPTPPSNFDYSQFPSIAGETPVTTIAPEVVANIEAAGGQPATQASRQIRLPAGSSLVTDKPPGKFRKATAEEAAEYNALAGQFDEENRFYPAPVPTGAEVITENGKTTVRYGAGVGGKPTVKLGEGQQLVPDPSSPTGTRVANIPGGAAEQAAQQAASAEVAARNRAVEIGKVAISEIDRFIDYTGKMSKLPFASPLRKILGSVGFEEQAEAQSSLDTVASNLKFEALDALRKSSPTGSSGLGQVTQNEFSALADQWGTLRLVGDPEKIRERAISVKTKLLDVVHGTQQHRESLLKKGIITSDQYNEIQSQYPGEKQSTQEDDKIKGFRATFPSQPTQ
jgi:hypothetical protein